MGLEFKSRRCQVIRKKSVYSMVVGLSLVGVVAASAPGWAFGHRRETNMWLLARAAGLSRDQIVAAFRNDPNLKTDITNAHKARQAMVSCIVSAGSCTNQISTYANAQQALTQERMNIWQGLFKDAPNPKQAATVLGELQHLQSQRRQIYQQVIGSGSNGDLSK